MTYSCASQLPKQDIYAAKARGGWADGRMGQIYDLIDSIRVEQGFGPDVDKQLKDLMDAVERADMELET